MGLSGGKKFCLWMIIIGGLALLAGSAAPYWLTLDAVLAKADYGLWFGCSRTAGSNDDCKLYGWTSFGFGDFTAWFYAVHAAAGLASLIILVVLCVALGKVCGESEAATGVGVCAFIGGLLGVGAAVVFYLKTTSALFAVSGLGLLDDEWDWAFVVFASGASVVAFFSVILLAIPGKSNSTVGPC